MAGEAVYPGETWAKKTPAEVGMDAAKLRAFSKFVGGRGCVTRHGYMVYTWGNASKRGDVASACKPWYSHFLFKALEDRKIASLDAKVSTLEPRLKGNDRDITFRHLANQTSCYGITEKPGTAFCYNDWQMAFFWDTLFLKVYGVTYDTVDEKVVHPLLTDLIQCEDKPTFMAFGKNNRAGRVGVSPRDFCRFGLLYLHKGNWKGKQLISRKHAAMAVGSPLPLSIPRAKGKAAEMIRGQRTIGSRNTPDNQCDHVGSYSWLWWTNGIGRDGKRHWPDVPQDAYGCFGHGGKRAMVVLPGLDVILSWNDTRIRGGEAENEALGLLVHAVVDAAAARKAGPLPGQIVVEPGHPQWFGRQGGGPFFLCGPGDPEDFLYRGSRRPDGTRDGDQMTLIRKLKGTGANCIYLMAVRSHGGDGDRTHNPFVDNDTAKGLNAKALDQWETWFAAMDEAGIAIFLFLYDDSARVWNTGDRVGTAERDFIQGLVNRFEHHKHLIWCVAEEYGERLSAKRASNIAAEIRAADDHGHPIAIHKNHGIDFAEFADDPNIDQFAIQYNVDSAAELHRGIVKAWKLAEGRYSLNMSEAAKHGSGRTARLNNWACAMGGAYVMILGMDIASTPLGDLKDCGTLVRFFESTSFQEMAPHDELAHAGTEYVLARPGHSYIAYASDLRATIGVKGMAAGTYALRWLDCATGVRVEQTDVRVAAGNHAWPKPPVLGSEVAVYVLRTDP
ncbi:hypothetical protein HQ576_14860 [bacterium]|nr:hypothetical protein [bacterium]